jgi:hypothetical protein
MAASTLALPSAASAADFPLKAWWPMAEGRGQTVRDWSFRGHNGTLGSTAGVDANDPTWIKGAYFGYGLRFDGNDFIRVPDHADLRPQRMTISMWVRAPQTPGAFSYLLSRGAQDCVAGSYALQTGWSGGLQFTVWDGTNVHPSASIAPEEIWDGAWHHVAGTYDGVNTRLYVDGEEIAGGSSFPGTVDYSGPTGATTIGAYRGSCDLFFTGDMDSVMIWSTPIDVTAVWNGLRALFGSPGSS